MKSALLAAALALAPAGTSVAQGYRLRVDTRAQTVSYRGVTLDSALASDTVTGPTGGPMTPGGFAVSCPPGSAYCSYFRPGPVVRAAPITTTADLSLWGIGVPGLRVRATGRLAKDVGEGFRWPGTTPGAQLLEGYAEYERDGVGLGWLDGFTSQLGRQTIATRLGFTAFDGARIAARDVASRVTAVMYAGWGLARGAALPVTSPALNPLDEFRPQRRQLVAGGAAGWTTSRVDLRANYLREVDPDVHYFVSERAALDYIARPRAAWSVSGGADYDIAAGLWGSAESTVRFAPNGHIDASLGVARYRPHFDLWTIWGAFSPVPFQSVQGAVSYAPFADLRIRAQGQRYRFDDAAVSTPLATYTASGWRFSSGATYTRGAWTLDAGYHAEFGPGASSRGVEGGISVRASEVLLFSAFVSTLDRPLEFRFDDATLRAYGLAADYRASSRLRMQVDGSGYAERRDRPDAAAFDWNQVRLSARVILLLGSDADLSGVPPAVRRMPGGREQR